MTRLWQGLLRRWPRIAAATLLVGGIAAFWVLGQPPLYTSEATLEIAAPPTAPAVREVEVAGSGVGGAGQTLGLGEGDGAPSLTPPTAAAGNGSGWAATLREEQNTTAAVASPMARKDISALLKTAVFNAAVSALIQADGSLGAEQRRTLQTYLGTDGGLGRGDWLRVEGEDSAVVDLRVRTPDPALSVALARATARALEEWDRRRMVRGLETLERSLAAQLREVDRQLAEPGLAAPVRRSLQSSQANLATGLALTRVRAQGVSGYMGQWPGTPVAQEVKLTSRLPAAVALVLATFLLALALAAVRAARDRRLYGSAPLRAAGLPVLAEFEPTKPGWAGAGSAGTGSAGTGSAGFRGTPAASALGFAAARLLSKPVAGGIIVLTSPRASSAGTALGEGLAAALTLAGRRVLVVEAQVSASSHARVQPAPAEVLAPASLTLWDALQAPADAEWRLTSVAGAPTRLAAGAVPAPHFTLAPHGRLGAVLEQLGQQFDDVIIDCPGLLDSPDALSFARHADHLVLALPLGQATLSDVQECVRLSQLARLPAPDLLVDGTVSGRRLPLRLPVRPPA